MDDLYQEIILEHYHNPNNKGEIVGGVEAQEMNMLCGDKLKITAKIENGKLVDAKFSGGGCAISQAAVDMLLDKIKGMKLDDIKKMKGEEIEEMLGVTLTPARKKCAYLGLEVMRKIG
jgi:nitrogen fixation NifU-like protein